MFFRGAFGPGDPVQLPRSWHHYKGGVGAVLRCGRHPAGASLEAHAATIRPVAGEPIWEFVERVPNWAIPLAYLMVRGIPRSRMEWLR
jgi:hypothetical protein